MIKKIVLSVLGLVLAVGLVFAGTVFYVLSTATVDTAGGVEFDTPLRVPPLAKSRVDATGRRVFGLTMQRGTSSFGAGGRTPTWGFNGAYLGPTLRAERGERVRVNVQNDLGETSSVHWHGMHLPARMDGGPHQMIRPGRTWHPTWKVDQPASTLWYHPHVHGTTAKHVYRGLAGMFILDDEEEGRLALPRTYGADDIPVVVQDKKFQDDGSLDDGAPFFSPVGVLGDTLLTNGTAGAYQRVTSERVRLRLLNGSNARVYNFGFDDGLRFDLIGTDGGLLPSPHRTSRLQLSPGERAEIVVAMSPGERRILRSYPIDGGNRLAGGDDTMDVLQLRAAKRLRPSPQVPDRLVPLDRLEPTKATRTRSFSVTSQKINRKAMDMSRIDEVVTRGDTEIWKVSNGDGAPHNFHVHDVQFQVLSIGGKAPPPHLRGWKDTVWVERRKPVRLIMKFTDYSDPDFPYMYHCHLLKHEDSGTMGQFVVVEPGQEAGSPPSSSGSAHEH